jgi:hypothetical protein
VISFRLFLFGVGSEGFLGKLAFALRGGSFSESFPYFRNNGYFYLKAWLPFRIGLWLALPSAPPLPPLFSFLHSPFPFTLLPSPFSPLPSPAPDSRDQP